MGSWSPRTRGHFALSSQGEASGPEKEHIPNVKSCRQNSVALTSQAFRLAQTAFCTLDSNVQGGLGRGRVVSA